MLPPPLPLLPPPGGPGMCHKAGGWGRGGCGIGRRGKGSALGSLSGGGEGRKKEGARRGEDGSRGGGGAGEHSRAARERRGREGTE